MSAMSRLLASSSSGEPVDAVHPRPPVIQLRWLRPTWSSSTPLRLDAERLGEVALQADRHVAQADGPVALVQERLGDDADRIGEVDDPGAGRRATADQLGELQHDRHGPQRLGEAAGAGRLLADGAEPQGERLVEEPRVLSADAELDQDEIGAVDRASRDHRSGSGAPPIPSRWQHPPASPPTTSQAFGVDVVEHELVDRQPVAPVA